MPRESHFIPGRPAAPERPLAPYRPPQPMGAASAYVRALTSPGDLVVDLFCQGPRFVREAVENGRRALGCSINPLLATAARIGLTQRHPQGLSAAFTHLADSPKGHRPLQSHLVSLYHSACPACGAMGIAEWLAWDRDLDYPFEKGVRCQDCGDVKAGPTDKQDVALARSIAPRGLAYYYALDRAATLDDPARDRTAELVNCYTPRNLSALMDLSRRLEGLGADRSVKTGLTAALLDCFDRGSKLYPYGEERPRPRTLRIPPRYLERNVWLCFEESLSDLLSGGPLPPVPEAEGIGPLVRGKADGYTLMACAARDIANIVPPESVALVFVDPPRPDGVFWALSALWAAWLWDSPEAHAMRPFLRRRRFDWGWHWQALREALRAVGPRLTAQGCLVTIFDAHDGDLLASVCLAASSAGYGLRGWGSTAATGHHLVWDWQGTERAQPNDVESLKQDLTIKAGAAITNILRRRGEPTRKSLLLASAHTSLAEHGLLDCVAALKNSTSPMALVAAAIGQAFDAAPITELVTGATRTDETLWWLIDAASAAGMLADRVEAAVQQLLMQGRVWNEDDLVNRVYARFPGVLTPDLELVRVCLESYGEYDGETICLRPEDGHERRQREIHAVREDLAALGERLGFDATSGRAWDIRWLEEGQERYVFAVSSTATMAPYLLGDRMPKTKAQRCLVAPGSRARLINFKLQRDPRLADAVEADRWQFIKFRHLRRLMAEQDLDRYAFKTVLGLDPIAEQESAQIPLF
jgi:hypothetical protein